MKLPVKDFWINRKKLVTHVLHLHWQSAHPRALGAGGKNDISMTVNGTTSCP